jgi:hypothetical protein
MRSKRSGRSFSRSRLNHSSFTKPPPNGAGDCCPDQAMRPRKSVRSRLTAGESRIRTVGPRWSKGAYHRAGGCCQTRLAAGREALNPTSKVPPKRLITFGIGSTDGSKHPPQRLEAER